MNEKALSQELQRVAGATQVPADLFPPGLLARRPRRRTGWLTAAAAAAALLVFLVTPLGARTVKAAGELIMQLTVKNVKVADRSALPPHLDTSAIQPGETVVSDEPGYIKQVATGMRMAELPADVPLPAYRAPGPDARVVRVETYPPGKKTLEAVVFRVRWHDGGKMLDYTYARRPKPFSPAELKQLQSGESPLLTVYTASGHDMEQTTVTLKGEPATATKLGNTWSLYWVHEYGGGSLMGTVELDELVKVAESLPSLR